MADVVIDGSFGEGGGQIIRTCLTLSALTGRAVEIENMRAGRSKPGLQPQHLASVRAAATICAARTEGERVGSTRLLFAPQASVQPGIYRFDIGTAGATALVMQTVAVPLAMTGRSRVTVTGGTHVPHAPPADYLETVYGPALERFGLLTEFCYSQAGFFPQGGGELRATIDAGEPRQPVNLTERGKLLSLRAFVVTANLPEHVADRGARTASHLLAGAPFSVEVIRRRMPSISTGASVVVVAACEGGFGGFTAIGERGKPMERVAEEACNGFCTWWDSSAACDERLSDQLILPAALATGESEWTTPRVTLHLRTVLWVAGQFLPVETNVDEHPDGSGRVTVRGAGMP